MLEEGVFPDDWKKSKVVPIYKNDAKILIKTYRPISPLPIVSKIFERLMFNFLFDYFIQNTVFTECQCCFIPAICVLLNLYQLSKKSTKVLIVIRRTI